LVFGGGGAVGLAAIHIAVATGCHVTTTCGSGSVDRVLKAGVEQAVNYSTQDVESTLKGQKFDAVFDTIGGEDTERIGVDLVKKGGNYMTVLGHLLSQTDKYGLLLGLSSGAGMLVKRKLQYRATRGIGYSWVIMSSNKNGMEEIRGLIESGKLRIPVDKVYPLAQTSEAHEAKEKGLVRGKIVLAID